MKRITKVKPVVPAVFGQIGAGEQAERRADTTPITVMMTEPTMAFSRPRQSIRAAGCSG